MSRLKEAAIGVIALALVAGAVTVTGYNLVNGGLRSNLVDAAAHFGVCGQGLRERGDVKLRGVLVGRIGEIAREQDRCTVTLELQPAQLDQIPANVGAQIRAKTVFGEKWVELLYPAAPSGTFAAGDVIPPDRTIDPLEVETILNLSGPLLDAIDPEALAATLDTLATGFGGQEDEAIRGIRAGLEALAPINEDPALAREGLRQLRESAEVFSNVDDDLLTALASLDRFNDFTVAEQLLIAENLRKAPALLRELGSLFDERFLDLTRIVNRGATVISVIAARADDLERLLNVLPRFNSAWIRNIDHVCEHRQLNDESGEIEEGGVVPGRCWRVHNILSDARPPYGPGRGPDPRQESTSVPPLGLDGRASLERLLGGTVSARGESR